MIADVLNLTRPLIVVDTETTGVDTANDRIVELAFKVYYHDGRDVKEYRTLVDPGNVPIPPSATKVHGITDAMVNGCRVCGARSEHAMDAIVQYGDGLLCDRYYPWPTFKQLAANLATGFKDCDYAGKNVRFDLRILSAEFARAGIEWSIGDARIVDADRLEALLVPRSLSHLYKKYTGEELEGAHGAMADVEGTDVVIGWQLQTHIVDTVELLPFDLDQLHALQFPGMIDLEGKFYFDDAGVPRFTRWGKHAGKPMKDVDAGYWDFILSNGFAAETKAIARKAKLGQFPVRRKA